MADDDSYGEGDVTDYVPEPTNYVESRGGTNTPPPSNPGNASPYPDDPIDVNTPLPSQGNDGDYGKALARVNAVITAYQSSMFQKAVDGFTGKETVQPVIEYRDRIQAGYAIAPSGSDLYNSCVKAMQALAQASESAYLDSSGSPKLTTSKIVGGIFSEIPDLQKFGASVTNTLLIVGAIVAIVVVGYFMSKG